MIEMKEKANIENSSWALVAKYLNHEASEEEARLVENWINSSGQNQKDFIVSKDLFEKAHIYYQSKRFDYKTAWNNVQLSINSQKTIALKQHKPVAFKAMKTIYRYAAAIVLITALGSLAYYFGFHGSSAGINEIASLDKQILKEVTLPDGSIVSLNGNSTLTYPDKFKGNTREVTIKGEAFFDIAHNAAKPFVITAGQAKIRVLGTSFNVNAYPETETIEVVVKTGKVEVTNQGQMADNQVILEPGEKGTLYKNKLKKTINQNPNYSAWLTHDLVFENTPMSEVIASLNSSYHITIIADDPEINNLNLTAHFTENQSVDYILDVIVLTFNLKLTVEDNTYILKSHKF